MKNTNTTLQIIKSKLISFWSFFHFPIIVGVCMIFLLALVGIWNGNYNKTNEQVTKTGNYIQWKIENIKNISTFFDNAGLIRDSGHYSFIAKNGGYTVYDDPKYLDLFAFFPLYPAQIRLTHEITQLNYSSSALLSGFINTLLFCSVLYLFLSQYTKDTSKLNTTFLIAILLPFNFFFFVSYTESLFSLLVLSIIYITIKIYESTSFKNWFWFLPILCLMVSLTRSPGVMVSAFLSCVLLEINYNSNWKVFIHKVKQNFHKNILILISILANIVGIFSFLLYGFVQTGNFWISRDIQANWGRGETKNIFEPIFDFIANPVLKCLAEICSLSDNTHNIYRGIALLISVCCIILAVKYFNNQILFKSILVLSVLFCILPLTTNTLLSYNRLSNVSPLYLVFLPIFIYNLIPKDYHKIFMIFMCMFYFIGISYYYKVEFIG